MIKHKLLVIGGGFGGVYFLRELHNKPEFSNFEITLITPNKNFEFTPLIHEVATNGLPDFLVENDFNVLFSAKNISVVNDYAQLIDPLTKNVKTTTAQFNYDYLVIATGAQTNFYNTPGAPEHTFELKTVADAHKIKDSLTMLDAGSNVVIVGGGPTGVELAAEIREFRPNLNVYLVCASDCLLEQFNSDLRQYSIKYLKKLGVNVQTNKIACEIRENEVVLKNGETLGSDLSIWVAGVKANIPQNTDHFELNAQKRLAIKPTLQTTKFTNIFALGDVAGESIMLAQNAVEQAKIASYNLVEVTKSTPKLKEFKYQVKGLLVSLGRKNALAQIKGLALKGWPIWFLWRTIYLFKVIGLRKKAQIAFYWTVNLLEGRKHRLNQ